MIWVGIWFKQYRLKAFGVQTAFPCPLLQQHFLYATVVGFFHKLVQPVFAEDVFRHFDNDVVGRHIVVVGVAAQALQAGWAGGEHFHRFALRQLFEVFLDFFLLAEFDLGGDVGAFDGKHAGFAAAAVA